MSTSRRQQITVAAIVVLLVTVPALWQLSDVRAAHAVDDKQSAAVDRQVTARQTANDYDGDGIPDSADTCPTRPETKNGFQDGDGCPDVVTTTGAS